MASHPISPTDLTGEAAQFRRFNRMYTRFNGTLNVGLLNSDYMLWRKPWVLYELANRVALRRCRHRGRAGSGSRVSKPHAL